MKLAILLVVGVIANVYGDEPEAIVGGNVASPGQFPYQVSLQLYGNHFCGGTIISNRHVVTAAHCMPSPANTNGLTVVTGTNDIENGGQVHQIMCIQVHPEYNPNTVSNDIALITLAEPMTFSGLQQSIFPATSDPATGQNNAVVSGWGMLGVNAGTPTMLQYVTTRVLSHSECRKVHSGTTYKQLCTFNSYGKGACMGDSGGPLVSDGQLIGVVSFGTPCAVGVPDVFTNVAHYGAWIRQCQQKCMYMAMNLNLSWVEIWLHKDNFHIKSPFRKTATIIAGDLLLATDISLLLLIAYLKIVREPWYTVVTGTNNLQNGGQVHRVKCIQVHEGYIPNIFANDIALITLAQPMTFHGLQRPISLASADYATGQTHCMISGWGRLGANANMPTMLQYVDTMALTRNDCVRAHPRTTAKQICTFNSYGKGACMGDSGGPLICNGQLVGVVSFGRPCAVGVPDTIRTGTNNVKSGGQIHQIKCIQVHSGFNMNTLKDDIAVIAVTKPMSFNNYQAPIPLASMDYANGQNRAIVSGWGQLGKNQGMPTMLQYVNVRMLSANECRKAHSDTNYKQICTFNSYGKGSCMGDSGGPLISNDQFVGVVSWGIPCAVGQPDFASCGRGNRITTIEIMKLAILLVVGVIAKVYGDEPEPIVGGYVASPGQFPYQVSIREADYHICGGSIIDKRHVLTAAHCISSPNIARYLTILAGTINVDGSGGKVYQVQSIQVHPQYDPWNQNANDIAVLRMVTPFQIDDLQSPISLASEDYANSQALCTVSGWGQLGANAPAPSLLQYVDMTALSHSNCRKAHPGVTFKQMCTFNSYGKGACMGDSGGPLVCNGKLAGVVSWGKPCAVGQPDVFTNVVHYQDWINQCLRSY
ncbi:serine protease 53-like [Odontomachus brunneus]|uniref:serine protease 53-like n=1 Tax=Odontomachus brunneus TaxID=486640 RepID=UPI0013F19039|nr:serine protease 53-like [Odontomachus brunneus]